VRYEILINTALHPGASTRNRNSGILPDWSCRLPSLPGPAMTRQARCLSDETRWKPVLLSEYEILVPKMPNSGEYHRHLALVSRRDHFFVTN
jgi:hypothetical protein